VRLQKRNGITHQLSDNASREYIHKGSSLENIVDAVVSIQGGEVSLKGQKTQ